MSPARFPATSPTTSPVMSPVLLQYQTFFATIVQHFCYIVSGEVSGEFPARSMCIVGEPFFATIGLVLLQTKYFLLLLVHYGSKSGI